MARWNFLERVLRESVRRSKWFLILEVESWRSGRRKEGGERLFLAIVY